ncbi:MAG: FtsQ-type POTRA domain-containing protein [Desulfuromonadaceae bacterium]|nr:FtsQ-type POTRA domain-containing protein [Desulfuromonadaceae bacterium]
MRDLKRQKKAPNKARQNRRKKQKKTLNLRKILHRSLRVSVALFSGALILVGGFVAGQLLIASDLFRIDQVNVQGGEGLSHRQIIALSDIQTGMNTFNLDLELIGRKIEGNPWVREARVQRIFPRQVAIQIRERKPVAIINLGYLYYLDDQGEVFKVLDAADQLDYPIITGFDYKKIEQRDRQYAGDLKAIVELLADLRQREKFKLSQISEIHRETGGSFALFTVNGAVKVKLGQDNFTEKLDRLERIYAQLQPRLSILDYIDLNVNEKVIVRIERSAKAARG